MCATHNTGRYSIVVKDGMLSPLMTSQDTGTRQKSSSSGHHMQNMLEQENINFCSRINEYDTKLVLKLQRPQPAFVFGMVGL